MVSKRKVRPDIYRADRTNKPINYYTVLLIRRRSCLFSAKASASSYAMVGGFNMKLKVECRGDQASERLKSSSEKLLFDIEIHAGRRLDSSHADIRSYWACLPSLNLVSKAPLGAIVSQMGENDARGALSIPWMPQPCVSSEVICDSLSESVKAGWSPSEA